MLINHLNKTNNEYLSADLGLLNKPIQQNSASFGNLLTDAINKVNSLEKASEDYTLKLASGELENIHEAMIASQKSEISLQFMMEIRNKVLDAYREIMRMQI
ncbi:flagellar hook-basal body complex protein FliE [Natronincola peptidivorans]|uniref:Flagellar hook-basal body complex protein FliE n=1 Tax=Natronincola peptidivorans TaxID=426128 RepID=A0A1H9YFK9_9FIRM|nr:flagellar hook-basal body complex protein FliE [Natronincola peptidivorans]SES67244.1 flagellar hook-basal body complex protein FliE [Natronincola peptidivorans]